MKDFDILKDKVFVAFILIDSPVDGLIPLRAARLTRLKDPKPTTVRPSDPREAVRLFMASMVCSRLSVMVAVTVLIKIPLWLTGEDNLHNGCLDECPLPTV